MMEQRSLLDQIVEYAESRQVTLPVFDPSAQELLEASRSGRYDITKVVGAIEREPSLAAEVLKHANSTFFGGLGEVRTIQAAILRLGLDQVANLVLMESERRRYRARHPELRQLMWRLWHHVQGTAFGACWIARRLQHRQLVEEVFIGGLIHDIGKLLQLRVLDEMMAEQSSTRFWAPDLVVEVLAQGHVGAGAGLLRAWSLPSIYVQIVEQHHAAHPDARNVPLLIVRLANLACHKVGLSMTPDASLDLSSTDEAHALGIGPVGLAELEVLLEDHLADASGRTPAGVVAAKR